MRYILDTTDEEDESLEQLSIRVNQSVEEIIENLIIMVMDAIKEETL